MFKNGAFMIIDFCWVKGIKQAAINTAGNTKNKTFLFIHVGLLIGL
jgi:hypothetical protein